MTLDELFSKPFAKGHLSEFLLSNIIGYLSFLQFRGDLVFACFENLLSTDSTFGFVESVLYLYIGYHPLCVYIVA